MSIRLTTPWQKAALAWLMELTKKSYEGTVQCSDQAIGEALQMQVDIQRLPNVNRCWITMATMYNKDGHSFFRDTDSLGRGTGAGQR